jgi:ADP-ribosylglycohydrolase
MSTFGIMKRLVAGANRMDAIKIQSAHIVQAASAFMSVAAPLNIVATFRNTEIDLWITERKLVCRITPRSAECPMAPVHLAIAVDREAEPDDEDTEGQLDLEQIVADIAGLEDE